MHSLGPVPKRVKWLLNMYVTREMDKATKNNLFHQKQFTELHHDNTGDEWHLQHVALNEMVDLQAYDLRCQEQATIQIDAIFVSFHYPNGSIYCPKHTSVFQTSREH